MNEPKRRGPKPKVAPEVQSAESPSQAYAMRVWNGQSPDMPRPERIARVIKALEGQNLPTEGIELP